ncbi:electron transport complex subunit RsxC [Vermiculatibacterium agrestimuris]|uniref:electron transport complex subunit RsxC n=1 Tax=Vermiculatibacterium agrestimuris TaxID=2941519 RepID=UPI00203BB5F3|nr:electron transport complex subunit RsxC [Vermiculatibacterium agrestimuris]
MLHQFFGGVHPAEHKDLTEHKATAPMAEAPAQVVIPMAMHVGAPCKPVVAAGDEVKVGTLIGETAGLGAPIHASVSGKVVAVEPRPYGGGGMMMSVVIENDFQDTPDPAIKRRENVEALTGAEIIEIVKNAGITGMGGAGFPTHVKLSGAVGKVDTVILNGAECEPYITSDHRLMLERGEAVIGGARLLAKAVGLKEATIGIELNKPDAIEHLKALVGEAGDVHIEGLKTRYPQGAEKQLIQMITGRQVPPGKLPADVQCVVCNVATAAAVWDAVTEGKPLTRRGVTLTGGAVAEPMNVMAPVGTPVSHLIKMAGGFKVDPDRVLYGGPMMGNPIYDLDVPMMKSTNCILSLTKDEVAEEDPAQTCIRCGKCVDACPMRLTPLFMRMRVNKRLWSEVEQLRVMDCIECGSCNYICPARLPLVQSFRTAKFAIRDEQAKARAAAEAKKEAAKA